MLHRELSVARSFYFYLCMCACVCVCTFTLSPHFRLPAHASFTYVSSVIISFLVAVKPSETKHGAKDSNAKTKFKNTKKK